MAAAAAADQNPKESEPRKPSNEAEEESEVAEEEYDEDYVGDDDEEEEERDASKVSAAEREKIQAVFQRLSSEEVGIRVHDVLIKGNTKTRDELIEAEVVDLLRAAPTVQALLRAASVATARLQQLDVFDAIKITLDAGPPELPGTTNVVIEVVEAANPVTGTAGVYSKPEVNPSLFVRCMSIACDVELLVAEDIEQCLSFLLDMD
jgi:outer membrane protein insertion porin family